MIDLTIISRVRFTGTRTKREPCLKFLECIRTVCWRHGGLVYLQLRHNELDGVSNHRRLNYLLNRLSRRRSKKTSKLHVTGLCEGYSPETGEFPAQRASNVENVSTWWRHHVVWDILPKCIGLTVYELKTEMWKKSIPHQNEITMPKTVISWFKWS